MKAGVNLWTVYGWSLDEPISDEILRALMQRGSQAIELVLDEGHNSEQNLLQRSAGIKSLLSESGVDMPSVATALFWTYNLASRDVDKRQRGSEIARAGCRVANAYGADVFLVVAGQQEPNTEYAVTYDNAVRSLQQVADYAADHGVVIGVENVPGSFLCSPGEYARFINDVGHPAVQAYLDIGNAMATGPSYSENWITAVKGKIAMIHVKDYDRELRSFAYCGEGDLNWTQIMDVLRGAGYDGHLMIETPPKEGRVLPSRVAGLHAAHANLLWMKQFI